MNIPDLFAIDNSKVWPIVAKSNCNRIVVQEDYDSSTPPTVDLLQYSANSGQAPGQAPTYSASGARVAKGTPAVYTSANGGYTAGETVGGIKTSSGSATMQQVEQKTI